MKSVLYKNLSEDPTDPALSALRLGISVLYYQESMHLKISDTFNPFAAY
jgi:hypothetical protein